jgi:hypothetical protein
MSIVGGLGAGLGKGAVRCAAAPFRLAALVARGGAGGLALLAAALTTGGRGAAGAAEALVGLAASAALRPPRA